MAGSMVNFEFAEFRFDETGFLKATNSAANKLVLNAVKEFLYVAAQRIPVLTGMAQGSLRPLAEFVGAVMPTITPIKYRVGRGIEAGAAQGTGHQYTVKGGIYQVTFNPQVIHLQINDWNPMNYGSDKAVTPWHAFKAGQEAALGYLIQNAGNQLPNPRKYLIRATAKKGRRLS